MAHTLFTTVVTNHRTLFRAVLDHVAGLLAVPAFNLACGGTLGTAVPYLLGTFFENWDRLQLTLLPRSRSICRLPGGFPYTRRS